MSTPSSGKTEKCGLVLEEASGSLYSLDLNDDEAAEGIHSFGDAGLGRTCRLAGQPAPRLTGYVRSVILLVQLNNFCDTPHALQRCGMLHSCRVEWREPGGNRLESLEIAGSLKVEPDRPIKTIPCR